MKSPIHQHTVLVLNRNWQAINTTTPADAISQMVCGNAQGLCIENGNGMSPAPWEVWKDLAIRPSDQFIGTPHRKIRIPTVIVLAHFNKVPFKTLKFGFKGIWERDGGRCQYSGRALSPREANIDHIFPQSRGGPTTWENCVLSDRSINQRKADRTPKEAGLRLISQPTRPKSLPVTYLIRNRHGIPDWRHFLPDN